jgi:hypothetical protein
MRLSRVIAVAIALSAIRCGGDTSYSAAQQDYAIAVVEGDWATADGTFAVTICEDHTVTMERGGLDSWQVASGGRGHRLRSEEGCMGHSNTMAGAFTGSIARPDGTTMVLRGSAGFGTEDEPFKQPYPINLREGDSMLMGSVSGATLEAQVTIAGSLFGRLRLERRGPGKCR